MPTTPTPTNTDTSQIDEFGTLTSTFTVVGFTLALLNILFAVQHAWNRRTVYNYFLVLCLTTYASSFVPLMLSTMPTLQLPDGADSPESAAYEQWQEVDNLLKIWKALYGFAVLQYIFLVQVRFRVVKSVFKYHVLWDWAFAVITLVFYVVCSLTYGIFTTFPHTTVSLGQALATAAWTLYALVVDHFLSFTFIRELYYMRKRVGGRRAGWRRVVTALVAVCVVSWICLLLLVMANLAFPNDNLMRTFLFRLGYSFTPLEFSGALVFIYNAKRLMANPNASRKDPDRFEPPVQTTGFLSTFATSPTTPADSKGDLLSRKPPPTENFVADA
ncbi:hypothetical protein HDU87_008442 [Geranomyces variabilis]|uniref:Uncharacterized protein n=1 Tax=Geranomyces variabilis TaxID=109894 RepID=A0AAD5TCM5_9FUNG|nr:hypothetical protein HDU87_008442 [Geranomyces variabilis]